MSAERALLDRPFSISVVRSRGEVAVVPVGGVDLASAEILRHQIAKAQAGGAAQIVLDLTDVHFIDSTGLRMLLNIRNDAKRNHQTLTLVASAPTARRIFKITGTRGLFDWRADSTSPVKERADPRHELPTAHDVAISRFRFSLNDESPEML